MQRFIPEGAEAHHDEAANAVAYFFTKPDGTPCAILYSGRRTKPDFWYRFRSEQERQAYVEKGFARCRQNEVWKAELKAAKKAPSTLKQGEILVSSWGYEQTNVNFFEVIDAKGKTVIIRELAQDREYSQSMAGRCTPRPGEYKGPEQKHRVTQDSVKIEDFARAHRWDGKPKYFSEYA